MFVLGLQGSPRIKGNTGMLLDAFLNEAKRLGASTERLDLVRKKISPCLECGSCEKEGFCPIPDDMQEIYFLLWQADIVVAATPIFFYGPTAQLKALIDRSQVLWARKYVHNLSDPGRPWRNGVLLSLGATKGKNLFDGTLLTAKYFFDAVGARFAGSLTYRHVEGAGDIEKHPTALQEAKAEAQRLVTPYLNRRRVLFLCRDNARLSQMAGAFVRFHFGDRFEVDSAGTTPAERIDPAMAEAMGEKGIDMAFKRPQSVESVISRWKPNLVVSFGCEGARQAVADVDWQEWTISSSVGPSLEGMRIVRDVIEQKVAGLLGSTI